VYNDPSSIRKALLGLEESRRVRCYHCDHSQEIAPRAQSVSCSRCFQQLHTADVSVRAMHWGGSLRTTGVVVVQRRARVVCSEIVASLGVRILGAVEADIRSGGPVFIGPEAEVRGAIGATRLTVEPGALLAGGMIRVPAPLVDPARAARGQPA
jgi:cytoskeletal protein CcmA (bactofilin family)